MSTPTKIIHDCSTGVVTEVPLTADEIAELEAMSQRLAEERVIEEAAAEKVAADKASGNQKLRDLGLTDDEIAAVTS